MLLTKLLAKSYNFTKSNGANGTKSCKASQLCSAKICCGYWVSIFCCFAGIGSFDNSLDGIFLCCPGPGTKKFFSSIIIELEQQNCVMENQILRAISYIKNVSQKSPTAENILNHISKISASNIDLSFVNETTKELKNTIQISTAGNNHRTIITSETKDKNQKKLNINQLNNSTCDKTRVNNSINN